ncbi:MAG: LysM peptidoglycan-binding domain-containing M23 family metallopeptidase [Rickettsiales bacterium]|jgi:murein DD-endopeptidase MepM/ murein hydrolase activator NlpD|nr:LysM peptidoglycan-binding domain-containing M23 family metallopeptidase [Rickettsiales bacterium]
MNSRICALLFFICSLPLAACDLYPRITGDDSGMGILYKYQNERVASAQDSASGASTEYGTNAFAQYGGGSDNLYGGAGGDMQYADANDYAMPKPLQGQRAESENKRVETDKNAVTLPPFEPDDVLLVPARVAAADKKVEIVAPKAGIIEVQKGDTVFSISQRHNVPPRDLVSENNLSAPYAIHPGQKLRIPNARYHTVIAGDTLYSISRAYSVDINSLAQTNGLVAPYSLAVGQKLKLPATVAATAPIAPAGNAAEQELVRLNAEKQKIEEEKKKADAEKARAATEKQKQDADKKKAELDKQGKAADAKIIEQKQKISSTPTSKLPVAAGRTSTKFSWPVRGKIISDFGAKKNGLYNDGMNIAASAGTNVRAAENGVVAYAGNELKGMGNLVIIQHSGGWMTVYAHMDAMTVKRGARVSVGEKIGVVGKTGKVSEPQLHFEIRNGTKAYNPKTQMK